MRLNLDEAERLRLRNEAARRRAQRITRREEQRQRELALLQNQNMATTKKKLSKWSVVGLDITEAGFSKLHSKECKYEDDKKKYNLEAETFKRYTDNLILKVNRISAIGEFTISNGTKNCDVLKEYSNLTEAQVHATRDTTWPATDPPFADQAEADKFTDKQIKASTIGSYIHDSLSEDAKNQLNADKDKFVVESDGTTFFDGPSYYHLIATLVDPDNGHLVESAKSQLRRLNVRDFGFNVQKMLSEFKNLRSRVSELGGSYSEDDQFLDLWNCVKTMKEKEFTTFVKNLQDDQAMLPRATRDSVDQIITKLKAKQTRMTTNNEWNVISPEETMIMALVSHLEQQSNGNESIANKKKKKKLKGVDESEADINEDTENKNKSTGNYPIWKTEAPKEGEAVTQMKGDK